VLLFSWLPVAGDPLCAVAGWLRLPFWRCVLFMAAGKGLRYLALCSAAAMLATR
jgi:membrane protein YqaA with SNARE-associated domain